MVLITGSEKPGDSTEHARALVAPGHTTAVLESWLDSFKITVDCGHAAKCPDQIDRAVIHRKYHRLFRRQGELLCHRIIGEVVRGRVMRGPLSQVSLIDR